VSAVREYVLTLLVAAAVTYLLTPLVRWVAVKVGAVIPVRDRDVHNGLIPRMGGVAIFFGVAAGLLVAQELVPIRNWAFPGSGLFTGLLGAGALIVVIGIIDDRWGVNALAKLAGQVVAAGILVASGTQLWTFPEPNGHWFSLSQNEGIVLTILVVVATINAVNFIDGLDGLAAGIVCIAAVSFFVYYYSLITVVGLQAEAAPALVSIVLAGACLGFLPHNFFPARIFMGDTGSMLLGLLLAYVPIAALSSMDYTSLSFKANRFPEILPLLLPAAVMVVPYVDMLRAVFRRTRAGLSPFAADRGHLHHKLLDIGHPHRTSVLILYAWAAVFSGTVVGLSIVTTPLIFLAATTLAAVLALALLSMPRLRWWRRERPAPANAVPADPVPVLAASNGYQAAEPVPVPVAGSGLAELGGAGRGMAGRPDPSLEDTRVDLLADTQVDFWPAAGRHREDRGTGNGYRSNGGNGSRAGEYQSPPVPYDPQPSAFDEGSDPVPFDLEPAEYEDRSVHYDRPAAARASGNIVP
jgi:UDP-GlcNAc:undecaprenyl-phosphate/decaprenyl-phosphate GlcNAc-1-phosphate transferase